MADEGVLPTGPQTLVGTSSDQLLDKARSDAYASLHAEMPGMKMSPSTGIHNTNVSVSAPAIPSTPEPVFDQGAPPDDSMFVDAGEPVAPPVDQFVEAPPPPKKGWTFSNQLRKIANRGGQVAGDMSFGLADTLGDMAPDWLNAGIVWDDKGLRVVHGKEYNDASLVSRVADVLRDDQHVIVDNYDSVNTQDIKDAWNTGDKSHAAKLAAQYAAENGVASLPDMVAALAVAPAYFAGLASHYTQERAKNDGRETPTGKDVAIGTATAGMDFVLEKFGAEKVLGVLSKGNKGLWRRLFEGAIAEGATEAAQNPLEEVGSKMGTAKEGDLTFENLRDQAVFGGLGGLGGGVGLGAPVHLAQHIMAPAAVGHSGTAQPEQTPSAPGTASSETPTNAAPTPPVTPPADNSFVDAAAPVAPPVAPGAPKAAPVAPAVAPKAQVDEPSAEPVADLAAQIADMHDATTARKGVYLSAANLKAHGGLEGAKALAPGAQVVNNFDKKGGALIVKNQSEKVKAFNLRKKEPDMQKVLGALTGAGQGKPAVANAPVVQGVTPDGAVATESAVAPAEISAKVAQVAAEGKTPVVTTADQAVARREQLVAAEPKRAIVQLANGKDAAVHVEHETDTEMKVRLLDEQGEPTSQVVSVPKQKEAVAPAPAVEAMKPVGDRTDKPVSTESEANTEVAAEPAKAVKPKSTLESLPDVLEMHEKQETPEPGKKRPASLRERQDNASAFAQVLLQAAKESDAAPEVLARVVRAAKAAQNLTLKSKEATEKGQGTSHTRVSAIVEEMHRAARQLMGKATEADLAPAVSPKAAALKNRLTKSVPSPEVRQTSPTKVVEKGSQTTAEKIEVPVNPKYENEIVRRPKVSDQLQAKKLMEDFVHAPHEKVGELRTKIGAFLKETRPNSTPAEIAEVMQFLETQREEVNPSPTRPKKMSETLENDESVYDPDPNDGMSKVSRPSLAEQLKAKIFKSRAQKMWEDAHELLKSEGFYDRAQKLADNGQHIGAHYVMDQVIKSSADPVLTSLLTKIRQHLPDVPVHFVDKVRRYKNGVPSLDPSAGLFNLKTGQIQLALKTKFGLSAASLRALVHEFVHASTEYELAKNPNSELANRIEGLRKIAVLRAKKRLGSEFIDAHLAHFAGRGPRPATFDTGLYGLVNSSEFMTEAMTNPRFQQLLIQSEKFAGSAGLGPVQAPSLLVRIFRAIGKWLGVDNASLMDHVAETTQAVMEAQTKNASELYNKSNQDFYNEMPDGYRELFAADHMMIEQNGQGLKALFTEPKPVYGERELAAIAGEDAVKQARIFNHIVRSKAWNALRKTGVAFLSADQLFRGNRRFFGGETDASNPLTQLEEAGIEKNKQLNKMMDRAKPVAEKRIALDGVVDKSLGQLQIDTTMWKIDPTLAKVDQASVAKDLPKFDQRYDELVARFNKLPQAAKDVYVAERDYNRWAIRELRKAGVDVALQSYGIDKISDAQRRLLYGAKTQYDYEGLIGGPRKDGSTRPIDLGEELNVPLRAALKEFAGITENEGPYFHLGRQGEYVVSAKPEGERTFPNQAKAIEFAQRVQDLGPTSTAKVEHVGNEWQVKFKANYVSMHETKSDAEADTARMREAGFDVGMVTQKTLSRETTPLGAGMKELAAEAERRINKEGSDEGSEALIQSLRSAFLQLQAARSAYAGSRLARKNVAGVKAEDMRRNFAEHAQSQAWHTSQLFSAFREAAALAKVRGAARDSNANVDQDTMYRRGRIVAELGRRMTQEVRDYGVKTPANATIAKLGFMAYLASPAHALVNMTQNFTSGIPVAAARWGTARSFASFSRGMKLVAGPAFRSSMKAVFARGGTASQVHNAILAAVRNDPTMGKWAAGANSPLQQLIDRGVISHSYSNELASVATGDSARVARVFEWARLTPNMADAFNRISSALAVLELTKGDVRKTADFINETQIDYSQSNKPRAFKALARIPGGNALTMFKTYTQGMAHLLYSNLLNSFRGQRKAEAAKTFAGLVLANVLFAGVFKGAALEPMRLIAYAWQKLFGDDDEYYDMQNAMHMFLVEELGQKAGNIAAYGLPSAAGVDLSGRMGLSDLFFHNPPDLLTTDKTAFSQFLFDNVAGPPGQLLANNVSTFTSAMDRGEPFEAVSSIIPVKMYQDTVKAYELYDTGKRNSLGAQITDPSSTDALYQMMGFRPTSVAKQQEKTQFKIERQKFLDARKKAIVREYLTSDDKTSVLAKVAEFNKKNPGAQLTVGDFLKLQRAKQRAESEADGGPNRDPAVNKATNF